MNEMTVGTVSVDRVGRMVLPVAARWALVCAGSVRAYLFPAGKRICGIYCFPVIPRPQRQGVPFPHSPFGIAGPVPQHHHKSDLPAAAGSPGAQAAQMGRQA